MSKSWAGATCYFLHCIDGGAQDRYLDTLQSYGCKVVRLWVRAVTTTSEKGSLITQPCGEFEPTQFGQFDHVTLDRIDAVLPKLQQRGMKALISIHDANSLGLYDRAPPPDIYGQTYPNGTFYTNPDAAAHYDERIRAVVQYVSLAVPNTMWLNMPDHIMGFDIQNEPWVTISNPTDPSGWLQGRADHLRELLGWDNPIKVCSGAPGGDYNNNGNLADWVLAIGHIDVACVHYFSWQNPISADTGNAWLTAARNANKLLLVEEWETREDAPEDGPTRNGQYQDGANAFNALGIAWLYWQALPSETAPFNDGDYSGIYVDDKDIHFGDPMAAAAGIDGAQDWTGIIY